MPCVIMSAGRASQKFAVSNVIKELCPNNPLYLLTVREEVDKYGTVCFCVRRGYSARTWCPLPGG